MSQWRVHEPQGSIGNGLDAPIYICLQTLGAYVHIHLRDQAFDLGPPQPAHLIILTIKS